MIALVTDGKLGGRRIYARGEMTISFLEIVGRIIVLFLFADGT
jgi:hypothetical protein